MKGRLKKSITLKVPKHRNEHTEQWASVHDKFMSSKRRCSKTRRLTVLCRKVASRLYKASISEAVP